MRLKYWRKLKNGEIIEDSILCEFADCRDQLITVESAFKNSLVKYEIITCLKDWKEYYDEIKEIGYTLVNKGKITPDEFTLLRNITKPTVSQKLERKFITSQILPNIKKALAIIRRVNSNDRYMHIINFLEKQIHILEK